MPTPFYHLLIAQDLFSAADSQPSLAARRLLQSEWAAFLFGNTAPDVQVISRQERTETHFFDVPILAGAPPPWTTLLRRHPELAEPQRLPPAQAAFICGYLCHLLADWRWVNELYWPVFGPSTAWGDRRQRNYIHNVLRAYLDRQVLQRLDPQAGMRLEQAQPRQWLPFTTDAYLAEWRDLLHPQLQPGAAAATVEVFAARQGLDPQLFYRLLDSEAEMERQVFTYLPRLRLDTFYQNLLNETNRLIDRYLVHSSGVEQYLQIGKDCGSTTALTDYPGL